MSLISRRNNLNIVESVFKATVGRKFSARLIVSAVFDVTFNLIAYVGLP